MILTKKRWDALRADSTQSSTLEKIVDDQEVLEIIREMRAMCSMPKPHTVDEKADLVNAFFVMCPTKRITVRSVE